MTTRADLRGELENRLRDTANDVWTEAELNGYLAQAIQSLYPHWYLFETDTSVAGAGPIQTMPSGARNVHYIGVKKSTSTRVRVIRGWQEGTGEAMVPKVNITGDTLVWAWTTPHSAPTDDVTTLTIPGQAEEVVVLRAQITALESIITDRVKLARYFATQVREGVTENDIASALDALHASVDARMKDAPAPPQRVG